MHNIHAFIRFWENGGTKTPISRENGGETKERERFRLGFYCILLRIFSCRTASTETYGPPDALLRQGDRLEEIIRRYAVPASADCEDHLA